MFRLVHGFTLMIIILLATAMVHAQSAPSGRWWRTPQVVQSLRLTDGEIQQLESAFEESRLRMIDLKSRVEAEQFRLQSMMEKRNFDEAAIKGQHRKLDKARSDLADERFAFYVQVRRIIGHERLQRLTDYYNQTKRKKRRK